MKQTGTYEKNEIRDTNQCTSAVYTTQNDEANNKASSKKGDLETLGSPPVGPPYGVNSYILSTTLPAAGQGRATQHLSPEDLITTQPYTYTSQGILQYHTRIYKKKEKIGDNSREMIENSQW